MLLHLASPTRLYFQDVTDKEILLIKDYLEYEDQSVSYQLQNFKKAYWFIDKYGVEAHKEKLQELEKLRFQTLLMKDEWGYYTNSGLANQLCGRFRAQFTNSVKIPKSGILGYVKPLPFKLHPEQEKAVEHLVKHRHGCVSFATGIGKTNVALEAVKEIGLKTTIITPSINIADAIFDLFEYHLGKDKVGKFYDGKKQSDKLITVGVAASLSRIAPKTIHWTNLSESQVVISDEGHFNGADTFKGICLGLLKDAPYRWFFTATPYRSDGLDLLLQSIIGPVISEISLKEGIEKGYLAQPIVTMFNVESNSSYQSKMPNKMVTEHFYKNPTINTTAANIANQFAAKGESVLILIDELIQYSLLQPHLKYKNALACGKQAKTNKVHNDYIKEDSKELVKAFNKGEIPILVGTSAVSTGTNFLRNTATIYLVSGASPIAARQGALGRSTRKCAEINKTSCHVIDFSVDNIPLLKRHAGIRKKIYIQELGSVKDVVYKG